MAPSCKLRLVRFSARLRFQDRAECGKNNAYNNGHFFGFAAAPTPLGQFFLHSTNFPIDFVLGLQMKLHVCQASEPLAVQFCEVWTCYSTCIQTLYRNSTKTENLNKSMHLVSIISVSIQLVCPKVLDIIFL